MSSRAYWKTAFTSLWVLILPSICFAQRGNNWYFGSNAGLTFNTSPPTPLMDGNISTQEGCATLSDSNGKILLYSDGITVYNKDHVVLANDLTGDPSSTQSAIIVPVPASPTLVYIFTVREKAGRLCFSVIDLAMNGGSGGFVSKNTELLVRSTEKITAVNNATGDGVWIIGHEWPNNKFYAWLLTPAGLDTPVVSSTGTIVLSTTSHAIGYLKASPNGKKLAMAVPAARVMEVLDFDATNGHITNPVDLTEQRMGVTGIYGVEFSADSKYLYGANFSELYQLKMPVSPGNVKDQGILLSVSPSPAVYGALQLAPDGKIYLARENKPFLGVIDEPQNAGTACNFVEDGVSLNGRLSHIGLPSFNQSFFRYSGFVSTNLCIDGPPTEFRLNPGDSNFDKVQWDFGDPLSGNANTSMELSPLHKFSKAGTFEIIVTTYTNGVPTPFKESVTIYSKPAVSLGPDLALLYGQTATLTAGVNTDTYLWNTGETTNSYTVTKPGMYNVTVTNQGGCSSTDEVVVSYDQLITVTLPEEISICAGNTVTLDAKMPGATYTWSTGSKASSISVADAGTYWVDVLNAYGNRNKRLTTVVSNYKFNSISCSGVLICGPSAATLNAQGAKAGESYNWYDENKNFLAQTSGTFQTGVLDKTTTFYVALALGKCVGEMVSVVVSYDKVTAKTSYKEIVVDLGQQISLEASGGEHYTWEPAAFLDSPLSAVTNCTPTDDITYTVRVYNDDGCYDLDTVAIKMRFPLVIPNTFTPNSDGVNDYWVIKNLERYTSPKLTIFNRNGETIRRFIGAGNNWDGTVNSIPVPVGVYFYLLEVPGYQTKSGSLTLLR